MKKFILTMTALFMLSATGFAQSGTTGSLTWDLSNGTLTISGTGAMPSYSTPDYAPWFAYRSSIATVVIGDGVTSIGDYAFSLCSALTSITIPNSVTSIGNYAFQSCIELTSVTIPNSVTSIGASAFYYCIGLTDITIPNSVTSIGEYAFYYCSALTFVTIPNSVTSIGNRAFRQCQALTSVTIPNSVTSIGVNAFYYCSALTAIDVSEDNTAYASENGVLFNKAKSNLIKYPEGKQDASYTVPSSVTSIGEYAFFDCINLTSVTIPESVTSIVYAAFSYCSGLTSVTIPNSVTSIGEYAFYYCSGLTSVTIPNSVTSIGNFAFERCSALTAIDVSEDNTAYASENGVLFNKAKSNLIQYPEGKQDAGYTIPSSVTSIGDYAFYSCSALTSVTIPNSVTSIGRYAFPYCSGLTSVTIPESVTSIGDGAFYSCSGLTLVTIGSSVTSIGNDAFSACTSLPAIDVSENNTAYTSENGVLFNKAKSDLIQYPAGKQDASYNIPNSVTSIGYSAFERCRSLTSVTITESVTSIGDWAFYSCSGLTSVTNLNSTPQSINNNVFNNVGLSNVTLYVPASSVEDYKATTIWNYFGNIVSTTFHVSITANNPSMGTVTGTGDYEKNSMVTISATADPGYRFVKWDDDNTQNPRTITVTKDITYTAIFEVITYHVTVNANNTSMGTVTGTGDYAENSTATISAIANQGYRFVKWDDDNTQNPRTITVTQDTTYTAIFEAIIHHVTVSANNTSMGNVAGTGDYEENSTVTISATANPGYRFVKWDDDNTQNPRTITVTQDTTYTAIFEVVITYHVTVNANNPSMGNVTGTGDYAENSTATISAIANQGYRFVKWGDNDTQNPRTITVTHDINYTAVFDVNTNIQQTPDNDFSIYPNPVVENFRINGITAPTEVIVTDISGRIVLQQTIKADESVEVGNLPKGIYLVSVNGKTLKVVKK